MSGPHEGALPESVPVLPVIRSRATRNSPLSPPVTELVTVSESGTKNRSVRALTPKNRATASFLSGVHFSMLPSRVIPENNLVRDLLLLSVCQGARG
ncbi:hypothetical protein CDAR_443721 [Caerostris darwini]|uniref:Uncharacterized protein n=1 Tax=Caerostris darwini TaxID=1538125 RepID=A0AAV4X756_9ARAC|nr:hypothetical protein CDAR_443721 [Caerostris darwini]